MTSGAQAYTVEEVLRIAAVSKSTLYVALRRDELAARKRGRRTIILDTELQAWLRSLPRYIPNNEASQKPENL